MKRYWDKTEKERSAMTAEQLEGFIEVELMEAGVLRPRTLALEELESANLGEKITKYGVKFAGKFSREEGKYYFDTLEQAQKFIALNPMAEDYDYNIGREMHYLIPMTEMGIEIKEFYRHENIIRASSILKKNEETRKRNEELRKEYEKSCTAVRQATENLWADWYKCTGLADEYQEIKDTYDKYLAMADGNPTTAMRFLGKAYDAMKIKEAFQWFEIDTQEVGVASND
jgi:hypothetical protein